MQITPAEKQIRALEYLMIPSLIFRVKYFMMTCTAYVIFYQEAQEKDDAFLGKQG